MIYPAPKHKPQIKKARRFIPKVRKGLRASLEREASALWSRVVLTRDNYRCRIINPDGTRCASVGTDPHHIKSRRYKSTKWLPENGLTLCQHHHRVDLNNLTSNVIRTIGKEVFDRLSGLAYKGRNFTIEELQEQIIKLRKVLTNEK
jgi:hypothetical protein